MTADDRTLIRPLTAADWPQVERIYLDGIATGDATFETGSPGWAAFDAGKHPDLRLVLADVDGRVLGWATGSTVSDRCVYAGVVESSIYIAEQARGRGVGRRLLDEFVRASEAAGIWTLQTGIFPENAASLALHERAGFRRLGIRERVGRHHGVWRDVVLLERRSPVVGR